MFKRAVAVEYLQTGVPRTEIAMKYGLPSVQTVSNWVSCCLTPLEIQTKCVNLPRINISEFEMTEKESTPNTIPVEDQNATKDLPQTEQDVCYWLTHDGRAFLSWPPKWREELSKWAFAVAVRNNLLVPSAIDKNQFFLADCLFARRGRPRKD